MVSKKKKPAAFDIDSLCADDTLGPERLDSPRTIDFHRSESKEMGLDYTLSAGTDSVTLDRQWTLDQNWTLDEVNRVLGKNHHYRPAFEEQMVGDIDDGLRVHNETRPLKKNVYYNPTSMCWLAPVNAWLPSRNLEILAVLVLYNFIVVMMTAFTGICGDPGEYDPTGFCNEDWFLFNGNMLSLIGVALFMLLAFRLNVAVSRNRESRRQFEKLESACRNVVRQICFHVEIVHDKEAWERRRAVAFISSFPICVKLQLREEKNAVSDLCNILIHQDILNILKASSMPQFCIDNVSFYLMGAAREKRLSGARLAAIETSGLAPMVEAMGALQAMNSTPVPLSYTFQLRFLLIMWLVLYPLHLVVDHGFFTIIFAFLVDYMFLGIESMACEFDNPFGYDKNDLDLDTICVELDKELDEILVRVEHGDRDHIFDTWEIARKNEELIYRASSQELDMLTAKDKVAKQSRAQFVRTATKGFDRFSCTDSVLSEA
jgi:putative membrane protein